MARECPRCGTVHEDYATACESCGANFAPGRARQPKRPAVKTEPSRAQESGAYRYFHTKVAGATHTNPHGTSRQRIIACVRENENLRLVREPDNHYDPRAVKVVRTNGEQIGYLPGHIVGNDKGIGWCVADHMDAGVRYWARVAKVTGGTGDKDYGVNLAVAFWSGPGEPEGLPWIEVPARLTAKSSGCGCATVVLVAMLLCIVMLLA